MNSYVNKSRTHVCRSHELTFIVRQHSGGSHQAYVNERVAISRMKESRTHS